MNRGEIWTVAGGSHYAGKPRPVAILQNDPFTPDVNNGLRSASWLMADKVFTVPKTNPGTLIGRIDKATLNKLSHAVTVFSDLIPGRRRQSRATNPVRPK